MSSLPIYHSRIAFIEKKESTVFKAMRATGASRGARQLCGTRWHPLHILIAAMGCTTIMMVWEQSQFVPDTQANPSVEMAVQPVVVDQWTHHDFSAKDLSRRDAIECTVSDDIVAPLQPESSGNVTP